MLPLPLVTHCSEVGGKIIPDYTAQEPTAQPSAHSPLWERQVSWLKTICICFGMMIVDLDLKHSASRHSPEKK
jgi:hypothetical protein